MLITRGRVLAQRFFDIAEEVNLTRAESCIRELSRRPRFVGSAKHIELPSPPLEMALGPRNLDLVGHRLHDIVVRIYNTGAVVVTLVLDLPDPSEPESLVALAQDLAAAEDAITEIARPIAMEIKAAIRPASKISDLTSDIVEDYTIFCVQTTEPHAQSHTIGHHLDIPRLLAADKGALGEQERLSLQHASYSYRPDDLVVIDWNSALILDPQGAQEVAELLEFTVMQMLELRTYDSLVGRALDRVYKDLDDSDRSPWRTRNWPELSRRIMKLFVDVVEIAERVENSVTFLGDTWLARLHGAAALEFGIPRWQKQLRSKLEVMHQINKLLADQIQSQRSMRIELVIVGLILIEVILALFR